jgi:heterodisulfide reductase subunit A-like polyferredoxin
MVRLILQKRSATDIDNATSNPALDFAEKNKAVVASRRKKAMSSQPKARPVRGHREGLIAAAIGSAPLEKVDSADPSSNATASPLQALASTEFTAGSFSRKSR